MRKSFLGVCLLFCASVAGAQKLEKIPFGDFQNWLKRDIKESFFLGGNTKRVYAIAPNGHVVGEIPYRRGVSPWSTSNAMANVLGIAKTSTTVFPEDLGGGNLCAKLESMMVTCKVLGVVNISVMVAGSIFLGETIEPIKDADNPYTKLDMGIEFNKKPTALVLDYWAKISQDNLITTAKGWSVSTAPGKDAGQIFVLLQNRKEMPDGSIVAKRVGTTKEYISKSTAGWIKDYRLPIHYGNITKEPFYKTYMGLTNVYYAKNSKGNVVRVVENGWADKDEDVTHAVVFISSSSYEAFVGAIGNVIKVDNVRFEY